MLKELETILSENNRAKSGLTFGKETNARVPQTAPPLLKKKIAEWGPPRGMDISGPPLDQMISALIEDIYQRGLDRKVLLVV